MVKSLSFTKNGDKVAEITFRPGEAFLRKEESKSEILETGKHMARRVRWLCEAVDYDVYDNGYNCEILEGENHALTLIAFNSNKFGLQICINDIPMYSGKLSYTEF